MLKRISSRAVIYPLIVLAIAFFLNKHKELVKDKERQEAVPAPVERVVLDGAKPAELVPPSAPAFPELIFFHENNLPDQTIVSRLRDKYYKSCNVQPVDLTKNSAMKQRYADQKTPFAVFSLPDGTTITVQAISNYEFFDKMLESMLKTYELKNKKSEQPKRAPSAEHKAFKKENSMVKEK